MQNNDSINRDLKLVITFLKSMIVKEIRKDFWLIWDDKKQANKKKYFQLVECREVSIDQTFGSLRVHRTLEGNDGFFIEGDNLKYQIMPDMLGYVLKQLSKAIK